jgi:hypothetical protein
MQASIWSGRYRGGSVAPVTSNPYQRQALLLVGQYVAGRHYVMFILPDRQLPFLSVSMFKSDVSFASCFLSRASL